MKTTRKDFDFETAAPQPQPNQTALLSPRPQVSFQNPKKNASSCASTHMIVPAFNSSIINNNTQQKQKKRSNMAQVQETPLPVTTLSVAPPANAAPANAQAPPAPAAGGATPASLYVGELGINCKF